MVIFGAPQPIEQGEQILRARRTAALTRVAMGIAGIAMILAEPYLGSAVTLAGFATVALSAGVQLAAPRTGTLAVEETVSASAAVLIVGLGSQRVDVISVLWVVAIASGVLARGGRAHWIGRFVVMGALVLPVIRYGSLDASYAVFVIAVTALLMTAGRLTDRAEPAAARGAAAGRQRRDTAARRGHRSAGERAGAAGARLGPGRPFGR